VLLRWRTASEAALVGFNVYRERSGVRARLNRTLLPVARRSYSLRDRWVRDVRYWLEVVRLDGTSARFGPVGVR